MSNIKNRLRAYKEVKAKANEYQIQIKELDEYISCSGVSYEFKGGHTNSINSTTQDTALKLIEDKAILTSVYKTQLREVERLDNALEMLSEKERQAITLRYIEIYPLPYVCVEIDRSETTTKRFIRTGLEKMEKLLKK